MRRFSIAIWTTALLSLGAAEAAASWWNVEHEDHRSWTVAISGGMFRQDLDGKLEADWQFGKGAVDLDVLDLKHEYSGWAEIDFQPFQRHHLRFLYLPIEYDSYTILEQAIVFQGVTFDASDRVVSDVDLDTYEFSYRFDFYLGKYVTLSPLIQVSLVDARLKVADETQSLTVDESQLVPIPAVGLRAEVYPIAHIGAFAEGKGLTIGRRGSMWDAQGGLRLHLIRNAFLTASYRVVDFHVDYLDVDVDVRTHGPFVGATLRF